MSDNPEGKQSPDEEGFVIPENNIKLIELFESMNINFSIAAPIAPSEQSRCEISLPTQEANPSQTVSDPEKTIFYIRRDQTEIIDLYREQNIPFEIIDDES